MISEPCTKKSSSSGPWGYFGRNSCNGNGCQSKVSISVSLISISDEVTRGWDCAVLARVSFEILDIQDLVFLGYSRVIWSIIKLHRFISPSMEECIKARNMQDMCPNVGGWGPLTRVSEAKNGNLKARYTFITIETRFEYTREHVHIHTINDKNTRVYVNCKVPGCYFADNRTAAIKCKIIFAVIYNIIFTLCGNALRYGIYTLKCYLRR